MDKPKTTIGMKFDPSQWDTGKGVAQMRPGISRLYIQPALDPGDELLFTVEYQANGRLFRVEGRAPRDAVLAEYVFHALERDWWKLSAEEAPAPRDSWFNGS